MGNGWLRRAVGIHPDLAGVGSCRGDQVATQHALSRHVWYTQAPEGVSIVSVDAFDLCKRFAEGSMQGPGLGRRGEMYSGRFETPPDEVEPTSSTSSISSSMHRRDFLRLSGTGLAGAVLLGSASGRVLA